MGCSAFETKRRKKLEKKANKVKFGTQKHITDIEADLENLEMEINSMIKKYHSLKSTPGKSKFKIDDLKRDIKGKMIMYNVSLKHRRALKNNLEIVEIKERENKVVEQLKRNNEFLKVIGEGNDIIIENNNNLLLEQKEAIDKNNALFKEGDIMYVGIDNQHIDDEINNFNSQ